MKMNKIAAAVALAGVAAAPMAQAQVTLTGQVAVGIIGSDADDAFDDDGVRTSSGDLRFFGDDATINVNAVGTLDSGLTGYANYRTDLGLTGDPATGDGIHVGIKGDFGDIRLGEVPNAIEYGQLGSDLLGDVDGDENAGISYTGSFGSATVGVNWSPDGVGMADRVGAGVKFGVGGFNVGIGAGSVGDDSKMSVGASFALGGATVGLGYGDLDNDTTAINAVISYGAGNATFGLKFGAVDGGAADGDTKIRLDAGYGLGASMTVSARVNMFTDDSDSAGDVTDYRVVLVKAF